MCLRRPALRPRRLSIARPRAPVIVLLGLCISSYPVALDSLVRAADGEPPEIIFASAIHYGVGDGPSSVITGDFDKDGALDLAISNPGFGYPGSRDVSILLGRGDGTFAPEARFQLGTASQALVVGDYDADGNDDLAGSAYSAEGFSMGAVFVSLGNGDGTFAPATGHDAGLHPSFLVSADFDGDGLNDIALASSVGGITVLLNQGGGAFGPHILVWPDSPSSTKLTSLVAGRFNTDSLTDLAASSFYPFECSSGGVALWLSLGAGAFSPPTGFTEICTADIAAPDLDADGLDDLVVVNTVSMGSLSARLNIGNATFGPPVSVLLMLYAAGVILNDFNGDGVLDAAVGSETGLLAVSPGLGGTSFGPETQFILTDEFRSMTAGDFNGDAAADLALTEPNLDSIALLLTGTPPANSPPVASAGQDAQAECTSPAGGLVHLNGAESTDPDSTPGTNDDIVRFEWMKDFGKAWQTLLGTDEVLDVPLPTGTHIITLRVTDSSAAIDTDELVVTIVDTVPPALSVSLEPSLLWPPDHHMMDIVASVIANDACSAVSVALQSVVSNEPDDAPGNGDGRTVGDIQGADLGMNDINFQLRAERSATGGGRTYEVTYRATDASGNEAVASTLATVPHDAVE